jgi:hypothetical protein
MPRPGITREQVFEAADALVREGQGPTVVSVRARLGGGSPNTIAPLLAEWKALHEHRQAVSLPPVPEPVETVLRQVWGVAWQQARDQLEGEREALGQARKAIEQERAEMLSEIERLDSELSAALEEVGKGRAALETERQAHEQVKSEAREARALAGEREKRIADLQAERERERQGRAEAEAALSALRIEAATLTERAAHVDELRALLKGLQDQHGRAESAVKTGATPGRRGKT